jgi:hypothetical protein
MAILSKGNTFSDGDQVTSTSLNNLVDNAAFVTGSGGTTDDATLEVNGSGRLQVKAIQTGNIASSAVTTAKIADDAVTTAKIADSNVTTAKIADDAVTNDKIADNAIQQAQMADNSVGTAEIIDANVTASKLDGAQTGSAPIYGVRAWVNFDGTDTAGNITGTASRTSPSTIATISMSGHGLKSDQYVFLDFASGITDGVYEVTFVDSNTFTINTAASTTVSGVSVTFVKATITSSGNIDFVSRSATGKYVVNFLTEMPNSNYIYSGSSIDASASSNSDMILGRINGGVKTTKAIELSVVNSGTIPSNTTETCFLFIG